MKLVKENRGSTGTKGTSGSIFPPLGAKKLGFTLLGMVASVAAFATDPDPAFNWSTQIGGLNTTVTDTLGANIAAVIGVLALFVGMGLIWKMIKKAGARGI